MRDEVDITHDRGWGREALGACLSFQEKGASCHGLTTALCRAASSSATLLLLLPRLCSSSALADASSALAALSACGHAGQELSGRGGRVAEQRGSGRRRRVSAAEAPVPAGATAPESPRR